MNAQATIKLRVPRQDLEQSSFFALENNAVNTWIDQLPKANLGYTAQQLYRAITELNRIRMLPGTRLPLLENLRKPIHYILQSLNKLYINQPLILPKQPYNVAKLARTLQQQLTTGYTIVATQTVALDRTSKVRNAKNIVAQAIHRAISGHTSNMLCHYQLYQPVKPETWHDVHQLYALARQQGLLDREINDSELDECSIEHSYIRALLFACSKPNQLRQEHFLPLLGPITHWAKYVSINSDPSSLFVVDTDSDQPPTYRAASSADVNEHWLDLDLSTLLTHLQQLQTDQHSELTIADADQSINTDLMLHLIHAWGTCNKRSSHRFSQHESMSLSIGLSTTHHFLSGELSFEALITEHGARTFSVQLENPFLKAQTRIHRQKDVWDSPYENNLGKTNVPLESIDYHMKKNEADESSKTDKKFHQHTAEIINSSATGYCVEWLGEIPVQTKPGEIVGIREHEHNWSVAIIRWALLLDGQLPQLGLELLSPSATPYGARIIQKTGAQSDYLRVLLLPAIPALQQPCSLLTPLIPFREGQKVVLNQQGKETTIQLTEKLNHIGAFGRFSFRDLNNKLTASQNHNESKRDDFDSLWESL